jgi:hypothetical protein
MSGLQTWMTEIGLKFKIENWATTSLMLRGHATNCSLREVNDFGVFTNVSKVFIMLQECILFVACKRVFLPIIFSTMPCHFIYSCTSNPFNVMAMLDNHMNKVHGECSNITVPVKSDLAGKDQISSMPVTSLAPVIICVLHVVSYFSYQKVFLACSMCHSPSRTCAHGR